MTTFELSKPPTEPPNRARRAMRVGVLFGSFLIAGLVGVAALVYVFGMGGTQGVELTRSKKTTYVTGPLRADGTVDYLAALNERFKRGVTLEHNASVLFWQALGPRPLADAVRDEFFQALGMPAPPKDGDYFITLEQFVDIEDVVGVIAGEADTQPQSTVEELDAQLDEAMMRPWTQEEFTRLAEWLRANEGPLALVVQASHLPRRYDPLVAAPDGLYRLLDAELPTAQALQWFAKALVVRAMQRASLGQVEEAWQDLLAVHRLSRLAAQGPTLLEGLVGVAIDGVACSAERALLQHVKLGPEQIARMRADLDQVAPLSDVVDKMDVGERFAWLDSMASAVGLMSRGAVDENDKDLGAELRKVGGRSVDWNRVFTETNAVWNRYIAACREPNRARRNRKLARLDEEFARKTVEATSVKATIGVILGSREAVTEYVGMVFYKYSLSCLSDATRHTVWVVAAACDAQDRGALDLELTKLAFAIAAYQVDQDKYPQQLDDLVPRYIAKVPDDVFSGGAIRYNADGEGYMLHSYGVNGLNEEVRGDNPKGDDLIVQMPASPERQRP